MSYNYDMSQIHAGIGFKASYGLVFTKQQC